jgi:hypothetical protein
MFLYNLLNVLVQIANKMGFKKNSIPKCIDFHEGITAASCIEPSKRIRHATRFLGIVSAVSHTGTGSAGKLCDPYGLAPTTALAR